MLRITKLCAVLLTVLLISGCAATQPIQAEIAATTGPVAQFAREIVAGTDLTVAQLITDSVSCVHDYSLSVRQMELVETSEIVLLSGAGLEAFMEDALASADVIVDCAEGVELTNLEGHDHHDHVHGADHDHSHEDDPHIWLDPLRALQMAENICVGLSDQYPEHAALFRANADGLVQRLMDLQDYGEAALRDLSCRELITFHDGFGYLASAFDLEIVAAIEEESGSEASAKDLMEIIEEIEYHNLPAVFTEINGSVSAASIIHAEIGVAVYDLDMIMGGSDYFAAMKRNFDTLKEALQ